MLKRIELFNEEETLQLGKTLSGLLHSPFVLYLSGELGAGKTTLARGILRGLGITGRIKSPTYTIVEPYASEKFEIYHFDCYRLTSPEMLWELDLAQYFHENSITLIEWPDKGLGCLPAADLIITLEQCADHRLLTCLGSTDRGSTLVGQL